jgi:alpha-amylase
MRFRLQAHPSPVLHTLLCGVAVSIVTGSVAHAAVIAQTFSFERTFPWTRMTALMPAAADLGIDALWIPPPTKSCSGTWSVGYDPYDRWDLGDKFQQGTIETLWGSRAELEALVQAAHDNGIEVYADAVLNHNGAGMNYSYPDFSYTDFHHNGAIQDWGDQWWLENGDMFGLEDLRQEKPYVRDHLLEWIEWIQSEIGIDGFRYDAVKHIPYWFWEDVADVDQGYTFGEALSGDVGYVSWYATTGMDMADFPLYYVIADVFKANASRRLGDLQGAGLDSDITVMFIENHDVGGPAKKNLAYAYILTRGGNVSLFIEDLLNPWLREQLLNQIWVHHNLGWGEQDWKVAAQDQVVYERRGNLLVGINRAYGDNTRTVNTSWRSIWLHDYSGNNPNDVWISSSGSVTITIPADNYVFYAPR